MVPGGTTAEAKLRLLAKRINSCQITTSHQSTSCIHQMTMCITEDMWQTDFKATIVKRARKQVVLVYGHVTNAADVSPFFQLANYEGMKKQFATMNLYQARVLMGSLGHVLRGSNSYTQTCGQRTFQVDRNGSNEIKINVNININIVKNGEVEFTCELTREDTSRLRCYLLMLSQVAENDITPRQIHTAALQDIIGGKGLDYKIALTDNRYQVDKISEKMFDLLGLDFERITEKHLDLLNQDIDIPRGVTAALELAHVNELF